MKRSTVLWITGVGLVGFMIHLANTRQAEPALSPIAPNEYVAASFSALAGAMKQLGPEQINRRERLSLMNAVSSAASAYRERRICDAFEDMNAFLRKANGMRGAARVALMERLYNSGRALRDSMFDPFVDKPGMSPPQCFDPESRSQPRLAILASDNQRFAAEISFGQPRLWTVQRGEETWTQLALPGLDALSGVPGLPSVPVWRGLIGVPRGATAALKVVAAPAVAETLQLNLYPYQSEPADAELPQVAPEFLDPPLAKDRAFYASERTYPPEPCVLTPLGTVRDLQVAQVLCAVGQYSPRGDQLRLFRSIRFDVRFDGGDGNFITEQTVSPFEPAGQLAVSAVLNSEAVAKHVGPAKFLLPRCAGEELLVLTHPDFRNAADALAVWKREKGIVTTVVEVGAGTAYDSADDIDGLIEFRYARCRTRPSYVLLLGDAEFVPPARTDYDTKGEYCGTCGDATTGSDWGYAIYPPVGPFEKLLADFGVGRIPVDSDDEAQAVVEKIIAYESSPPSLGFGSGAPFYTTVALAAQFQCCRMKEDGSPLADQSGRAQRSFAETAEIVRNALAAAGKDGERIYEETVDSDYTGDTEPNRYYNGSLLPADLRAGSGFAWDGSTADVIDAFNDGRFLVLHRDHGDSSGFSHPSFGTTDLDMLSNAERLPVVYSVNCASGYFDRETDIGDEDAAESFMEEMLMKTDGGMVGGLGDVRNSPTWANSALARGFFDATWPDLAPEFGGATSIRRLADILNHGRAYMMTQVGAPQTAGSVVLDAARAENIMWHVFGDPTLEMWTANPRPIRLNIDYRMFIRPEHLWVEYAEEGAIITATQLSAGGEIIPIGRAVVEDGVAVIPYYNDPQAGQPIQLSAAKENTVSVLLTAPWRRLPGSVRSRLQPVR